MLPEDVLPWSRSIGAGITPLKYRTKEAFKSGWTHPDNFLTEEEHSTRTLYQKINYGVVLGKDSGGLVDIDLDHEMARHVAPLFLPNTELIFGRKSSPQSHWLYRVPDPQTKLAWSDPEKGRGFVELRGNNHQTAIPPSVHPSGEEVFWDSQGDPGETTWNELAVACGKIAFASHLILHWNDWEGERHDFLLALAGAFIRSGMEPEELENYVRLACDINNYHDTDVQIRTINDTAKKLLSGEVMITGWPSLVKIVGEPIAAKYREWLHLVDPGNIFESTDAYNASLLVKHYGDRIRYNTSEKRWYLWRDITERGGRWLQDEKNVVMNFATEIGEIIQRNADRVTNTDAKDRMKKWGSASRNISRIRAILDLSQAEQEITVVTSDLDRDYFLLNMPNGTFNLETGAIQDADKQNLISKMTRVEYDPTARSHVFEEFLEFALPDPDLRRYVQKALGYSLTGSTVEEVFFVPYGSGQNGKGTLFNTLTYLLGDYAMHASVDSFTKQTGGRVRQDLATMAGARMVTTSEPNEGSQLDASIIKDITGGDPIRARFLYGREFQYQPQMKIWMSTNHLPHTDGMDPAIWRRIRVIPFVNSVSNDKRDNTLKDKLKEPYEMSGIFNWLVEGLLLWKEEGLGTANAIKEATETYRSDMDTFGGFLSEAVEYGEGPGFRTGRQALYTAYTRWCRDYGRKPVRSDTFRQGMLNDERVRAVTVKGRRVWSGVRLIDDALIDTLSAGFEKASVTH